MGKHSLPGMENALVSRYGERVQVFAAAIETGGGSGRCGKALDVKKKEIAIVAGSVYGTPRLSAISAVHVVLLDAFPVLVQALKINASLLAVGNVLAIPDPVCERLDKLGLPRRVIVGLRAIFFVVRVFGSALRDLFSCVVEFTGDAVEFSVGVGCAVVEVAVGVVDRGFAVEHVVREAVFLFFHPAGVVLGSDPVDFT